MFWTKAYPATITLAVRSSFQPAHRAKPCFEAPVVGLDPVVRMDLCAMQRRWDHLVEHPRVEAVPVGGDLDG
jgi:hypothetical protein